MYAIIYWIGSSSLFPETNYDRTLKVFESLAEAHLHAEKIKKEFDEYWGSQSQKDFNIFYQGKKEKTTRIISIEAVKE